MMKVERDRTDTWFFELVAFVATAIAFLSWFLNR